MAVLAAYLSRVESGALARDPAQVRAAERLSALAKALQGWKPRLFDRWAGRVGPGVHGVYLWGGVGRGKTMLLDLFFDEAPVGRKRRVHFHAFMLEVHEALAAQRARKDGEPLDRVAAEIARDARLLCFDEMQVTDIGDAMILGRLFEGLWRRGVTVVATSNRAPRDLYFDGLNRQLFLPFIRRLEAETEVIELDAVRDYRLERLEGGPVWFSPLGPDATAGLDRLWERLLAGEAERGERLRVAQGRVLQVERSGAGCARFSFAALCERPLGAADYLALAQRFHTLALDDIPRLGPEKRNEAKRFVTLIDTLYDRKTKLVASADGEPEALYPDGDGAFEFARTVSRLSEMRAHDYLAADRGD